VDAQLSLAVPGTLTLATHAASAQRPAAALGAAGALGLAVTPMQAAAALAGEPLTWTVADAVLVDLAGALRPGVSAQDLWWYIWPEIKASTAARPGMQYEIDFALLQECQPSASSYGGDLFYISVYYEFCS